MVHPLEYQYRNKRIVLYHVDHNRDIKLTLAHFMDEKVPKSSILRVIKKFDEDGEVPDPRPPKAPRKKPPRIMGWFPKRRADRFMFGWDEFESNNDPFSSSEPETEEPKPKATESKGEESQQTTENIVGIDPLNPFGIAKQESCWD